MRALVTAATRSAGMAMIGALTRAGFEIVAADRRKLPLGIRPRYGPLHHLDGGGDAGRAWSALVDLIRREKPDVALPLFDTGEFCRNRDELQRLTRVLVPDFESYSLASDKTATARECRELGIECPRGVSRREAADLLGRGSGGAPSAIVVKPNRNVGGGRGFAIAADAEAIGKAVARVERNWGQPLLQEFIPGDAGNMRTVNLIFDRASRLAACFTTRKLRQLPPQGGITALSVSTHEPELVEMVLPFFERRRWQGPAEVEIKIDARDGRPRLIEVNPRFWGYVGFPVRCGVDFPVIAARLALGEGAGAFACPSYPAGIRFIEPVSYLKSLALDLLFGSRRAATALGVRGELRRPMVGNNVPWDDPLFLLGKLLGDLQSLATRRTEE